MKPFLFKTLILAATLSALPARAINYDFLPVTITGAGAKFTSPNGNGVVTVTNTGGPFLGFNNTAYSSQFPNQFAASGTVPGWLAQADNTANYTNTFYLNNYALSSATVFGIWNITEEPNTYRIELFDTWGNAITPNLSFMAWDDDALAGNIGWYHMALNTSSGYLSTFQFKPSGIDCDAAFWNNIPPQTKKIVVTGKLGASNADGVVFYFAEPKTNACGIICPTNITVTTCGTNAVVNYPSPTLLGPCASNVTIVCNPPSGSVFPLGTNTVTCMAVAGPVVVDSCSFTITVVPSAYANAYDFLPVTITGPGAKFTSPNGNGVITVTNTGGPFLGFNNTPYSSQFPNLFPASGTVPGWLSQADDYANYTNTFYLNNFALTSNTVFGIWNITEETNTYRVQLFDGANNQISAPFNWNFIGYDDDALSGNIGWYHMVLNTSSGYLIPAQFKAGGIDCDAAFWNNLPLNTKKIVVTGNLGAANADGVVFYFAERRPCGCRITCGINNVTTTTCSSNAVVFYPPPMVSGSCGSNVTFFCNPPSGSVFPLGTNQVTCTAMDGPVLLDSCSFTVTVFSNCPAVLVDCNCLTNLPVLQTNACQALIPDLCQFSPQCWLSPIPLQCSQSPVAGTVVGPGNYPITVTFTDPMTGQTQACNVSFSVTVPVGGCGCVPPIITCPSNIVVNGYSGCDSNGRRVNYPLPQVSNGLLVSCTPPSGSLFPLGQTTLVTCVATNPCGSSQCSFTVTVNFAGVEPPCAAPPSNMVMWLTFDEPSGITAFNSSAGNNGTLLNAPARNPGQYVQGSLCFNGVNQYVQVKPYPAVQFGTNDLSMDAWVKPATLDNSVRVIVDHREENGAFVRGYSVFLGANNLLCFQLADGTFISYASTLVVPADGQWHFVAVTVKRDDPQGIRFYVDGVQDSLSHDPTSRPGSITAGPCYPLRVGSRSSSVTGLFIGCIDEVELFRRALTAAELGTIYEARCKGKCRVTCNPPDAVVIPNCGHPPQVALIFNNPSPVSQTFNYVIQPLSGCSLPPPISITPSNGTITVPAGQSVQGPYVTVVLPPGYSSGCSCIRMIATSTDGSLQLVCDGKLCYAAHGSGFCADVSPGFAWVTNLEPSSVVFSLSGSGTNPIVLTNPVIALLSPEQQPVSITPLPTLTIPPAGGGEVQIPYSLSLPNYDPGRLYRLQLEADMDGDGQYEQLASVRVLNVLPSTETGLTIERIPGGAVRLAWSDPCAILEVNTNLNNPAGWGTVPVQLSPWTFTPQRSVEFFRLRQ